MTDISNTRRRSGYWITGILTAVAVFALLYYGISQVLDNIVLPGNLVAYGVVAVIAGIIAALFIRYRLYAAATLFYIGLAAGFIQMYRMFYADADGWGDLTGLMSFIVFSVAGLLTGLLLQLIWFLVGYTREGRKDKTERTK